MITGLKFPQNLSGLYIDVIELLLACSVHIGEILVKFFFSKFMDGAKMFNEHILKIHFFERTFVKV